MQARLRAWLAEIRNPDGGWPYYAGRQSRIEPTSWALLALGHPGARQLLERWRSTGGLLIEPGLPSPNFAFNAVAALSLAPSSPTGRDIARTLLGIKGVKAANSSAIQQNSGIQAWPWMEGTVSWIEPTSWCMLAVKKLAFDEVATRARVDEAERLLRDRVCQDGGWNTGNPKVYGQGLLGHVPPTAVAVLALQDRRDEPIVKNAVAYLSRQAPLEGSTTVLALTWLALAAIGATTTELAAKLRGRVEIAQELGNVAVVAMMLYVLELEEKAAAPSAFML